MDAAFPLSGVDGPAYGLPYVLKTLPWAKLAGCRNIATTDGLHRPEGITDEEAMAMMKRQYGQIMEVAEAYDDNASSKETSDSDFAHKPFAALEALLKGQEKRK